LFVDSVTLFDITTFAHFVKMAKQTIQNFLSLVKFSHTVFAMPFAIVGFLTAVQLNSVEFNGLLLVKVILCMVFARNAAMAFNRYADRNFDKVNPRTFVREIPSGVISPLAALFFVIANCLLFLVTTWFINFTCFLLAPVALAVVLGYSYTKRFTPLCHLVLGLGLSLAPIGAFLAVANYFALPPILLSIAVLLWVSGFDIIYALQDEEFDRSQNLKSIPVMLGKQGSLNLSRFLHFTCSICLLVCGLLLESGTYFFLGWGIFSALLVYQQSLVKPDDLSRVNLAFFTTNGIASVVFLLFFFADHWFRFF
jgi:4-hydroxybenzoate polyprenyltransferase